MRHTFIVILLVFAANILTAQETHKIFDQGLEKFKTGYYQEAIKDFTTVVERNDQYHEAYYLRGRCYVELGKEREAMADFTTAVEMKPDYYPCLYYRGLLHAKQGNYNLAVKDYDACLKIAPKYKKAYVDRARAYLNLNKADKAIQDYSTAIRYRINSAEVFFERGKTYFDKEDYNNSILDFEDAIRIDTAYAIAFYYHGMAKEELGMLRDALNSYGEAIKYGHVDKDLYERRARLGYELYRFEACVEAYTLLIEKFKVHSGEIHYNRGFSYLMLRRYREAEDDFSRSIVYDKQNAKAFMYRGVTNFRLGKESAAFRDFNRAIQLDPDYFKIYEQRGILYYEQERWDLATADFNKAIELKPTGDSYYYRGAIKSLHNDKAGACEDLRKAAAMGQPRAVITVRDYCND